MGPDFTIVTPSFRQPDWLQLCASSIEDQEGVTVEHIVQDAGTDQLAATMTAWADKGGKLQTKPCAEGEAYAAGRDGYRFRLFQENDNGMYDAVNRGLRRSSGEILAYLNCDEQYLPGALARVKAYFAANPGVDVVFGDVLVVDGDGRYLCTRQIALPKEYHTRVCTLATFTASTFFRRRILDEKNLYFSDAWRDVGDAAWVLSLLSARVRMGLLGTFTSTFADTGENMNLKPNAIAEQRRLRESAPSWAQKLGPLWSAEFRLRKLVAGHYAPKPVTYEIFTAASPRKREAFEVSHPTFRWASRL